MMNPLTQTSSKQLYCCVCSRPDIKSEPWRKIDLFQLMKCNMCGLVHLNQVDALPETFLDDATEDSGAKLEYWGYPVYFEKHSHIFKHFFQERYLRIKSAKPPKGTWFDIGSGYGLWQKFLEDSGIQTRGVEIDAKAQKFCEQQKLDVKRISFEQFQTSEKFSVITMCDVLEHVEHPRSFLKKCSDLLASEGLLYIQVPCVIGARYPYNHSLGLPHHLWQFNPKTLRSLVEDCGFQTVGLTTGVQGVIKHYETGGPTLWTKFLWKLAMLSGRGNRLQLLARKQ